MSSRRRFLADTFGATVLASLPASLLADDAPQTDASQPGWDAGQLRHLLPTVSETEILIKASFIQPLSSPPSLRLGTTAVRGAMNDTAGEFWQFHAAGLQPGRRYTLALVSSNGRPLCGTWALSTFPPRDSQPERFRVLFFTCAGGHEALAYLPAAVRQRLLRRALSLQPDAAVANGDHVYWDLLSPAGGPRLGSSAEARKISGSFD